MEKLVEYDPQFSFPIIFHFIPRFTQSVTISTARELHKELGEILKKFPPVKCIKLPYKATTPAACANCTRACIHAGRVNRRGKK